MLINERTHYNRQRNYSSKKFYSKAHKLILKSNSRNTNLAGGSVHASEIGWAHGKKYTTQISNQGAQADLEMYKTSKIKYRYSQIRHFLDYRVQNLPENSSKTSLLGVLFKIGQALRSAVMKISCILNFSTNNFIKKSLPLSKTKKTKHSFKASFPICFIKRCIFNLEIRNTGLIYHRHWAVLLLSHFWGFLSRPHIFARTTWPQTLWPRWIMRPGD